MRIGLIVCRGNWSRDETTLLSGGYQALKGHLDRMPSRQLVLEYADRARRRRDRVSGEGLGLGVVNPRTDAIESAASIRARGAGAARLSRPACSSIPTADSARSRTADETRSLSRAESSRDG
jgi:5-methyltetrahydropteroyltriglutamate--homocysteine methyltransferase